MGTLNTLLESGVLDNDGAVLLYDTVRSVARNKNHQPPTGFRAWNDDAVITAAHDFLAGPRATARLVQLAAQATDDASFARLLETAILNYLRDEARRTTVGRQIRRIKAVVADAADITVDDDRVMFADGPDAPFGDDEALLVRAAMAVQATRRRWRPDAERQGPLTSREDMLALVRAVLTAAGGSVPLATIARVVARRFDLDTLPVTVSVDALDPAGPSSFDEVEVMDQVEVVLAQLTERERLVLPLLDMSSREIGKQIELGHSTVAKTQARLRSVLATLLPPGDTGAALLRAVTERLEGERHSRVDT